MAGVRDLQHLVLDRLATLDISQREAARRSNGMITYTTIGMIASGRHSGHISERTAQGLALALDIPESKVRDAAHMTRRTPQTEFRLPRKANRLSPRSRRAVLSMIDALLAEQESAVVS